MKNFFYKKKLYMEPKSIQQLMKERIARGGYWKTKSIRVITSDHPDPTRRFYKYVDRTFWVPTREEQEMEKRNHDLIMKAVIEKENRIRNPTFFSYSIRYPHPYKK